MAFTTKIPSIPSSICPCSCTTTSKFNNPPRKSNRFHLKLLKFQSLLLKSTYYLQTPSPKCTPTSFSLFNTHPDDEIAHISSPGLVALRLRSLVSEFRSLPEPIDRVKRLLDYASVLPRLGESTRSSENRVRGCAAQVWLEVERDEMGRMRFGAESDSEITKGFCSCLIFLLTGAYPEDVMKVKAEDLRDMNVGLPVRSRVNSWHNVLVNMQERTKNFLSEKDDEEVCQLDGSETLPSLVVSKGEVCVP